MTRKSPTQPCMSPETNINFKVITDHGRVVYKYIYIYSSIYVCASFCLFRDPSTRVLRIQYGFCYLKHLAQTTSVVPNLLMQPHIYKKLQTSEKDFSQSLPLQQRMLVWVVRLGLLLLVFALFVCAIEIGQITNITSPYKSSFTSKCMRYFLSNQTHITVNHKKLFLNNLSIYIN